MAAADTSTADSISGLGDILQQLMDVNIQTGVGIEASLRSEFKGQNKLLGEFLGKNLQLIADAITGANENKKGYFELIIHDMLPNIAKEDLADYIDIFCEKSKKLNK